MNFDRAIIQDEDVTPVPVVSEEYQGLIAETENLLRVIQETKDFEPGFEFINRLHNKGKAFAMSIGVMLSGMEEVWTPAEHEGETFYEAAKRETSLATVTIQRHVKIQRALESDVIPEMFLDEIKTLEQKSLIKVAELVEGQYEMTDKDWQAIAEAPDHRYVGQLARQIKKVAPRSNYLAITMDKDGNLVAHTAKEKVAIGKLDMWNYRNKIVEKAIDRLTGCSGVLITVKE